MIMIWDEDLVFGIGTRILGHWAWEGNLGCKLCTKWIIQSFDSYKFFPRQHFPVVSSKKPIKHAVQLHSQGYPSQLLNPISSYIVDQK